MSVALRVEEEDACRVGAGGDLRRRADLTDRGRHSLRVGGGVRLSLVNVNFSAAYVFNPHPVAPEGPGAVFVKLDVTTVFL